VKLVADNEGPKPGDLDQWGNPIEERETYDPYWHMDAEPEQVQDDWTPPSDAEVAAREAAIEKAGATVHAINGGRPIIATPFRSTLDELLLPRRQWLYGTHLLRGRVSLDVAAGGVGKSALKIGEALAMASGRQLYGHEIGRPDLPDSSPLRVWLYNLEDDSDELLLRTRAAMKHFGLTLEDLGGRLFLDSGLDQPCVVAKEGPSGTVIAEPLIASLMAEIRMRKIDVLILDPFVSSHTVSENDNAAIDAVVKQAWVKIAHGCNCSVNLVHHIRKGNGEEATADSARGASALIGAARSVQVFNRMTEDEAAKADIKPEHRRFYFRVTNEKANMAPPPERADWYHMKSVELDNGEKIGVATPWLWPIQRAAKPHEIAQARRALADGEWRESVQCSNWAGHALGSIFGVNPTDKAGKFKLAKIIADLIAAEYLEVVEKPDAKRMMKRFVVPGPNGGSGDE